MTEPAYPDALPAQHRLHWYAIERVLGQGGFGITYLARDTNLDQPVAIKEYLPVDVATRRPDATIRSRTDEQRERFRWGLDRFIKEARMLARFDHPNIVRVLSVFELNGTAYMVMRFEAGENLSSALESRGTLDEGELLRILLPVLDGLALVHEAGFIHRDIKPDNIHIRTDGTPVLLDFGSARSALGKAHTLTILVAPGYAPFEQYYSSSESQGPWTDLYGLGATCYRAIAGRAPIDAIARSKGILGSTRDVMVPASVVGAGRYSGRLLAAIDHALAFSEKDRPQSIDEWRKELVGDATAPTVPARTAPEGVAHPRTVSAGPTSPVSIPAKPSEDRPAAPRRPMAWSIAGVAVALLAILGAVYVFRGAPTPPAAPSPTAKPDPTTELKEKLSALESRVEEQQRQAAAEANRRREAEQKQQEAERARAEAEARRREAEAAAREARERATKAAPAKPATAPNVAAPPRPIPAKPEPAPPTVVTATKPVPVPPAEPARPPEPPTPAQQLATAEQSIARGNYADAVAVIRPLAEKGNARAQRMLGDLHASGRGAARDDAEARAWYEKAAKQYDGDAQAKLGDMYAGGRGVPRDNNLAYVWYGAAARNGVAAAKVQQDRIGATLQPAELEQVNRVIEGLVPPARRK